MLATITPSVLTGSIIAHPSKSYTQRAYAGALLKKGKTIIRRPGSSNDELAALAIVTNLGGRVTSSHNEVIIESNGIEPQTDIIDCGESGLAARMFTPIIALAEAAITITGSGSLLERPFSFFENILPHLGVGVDSKRGKLPLRIKGPLQPALVHVDGSLSSQYLTGLLMAYSAVALQQPVSITVSNLKSKPYIDLTLDIIGHFGLNVPTNRDYEEFAFPVFTPTPHEVIYSVEGDWSGAAFLLVGGAIAGKIVLNGLNANSLQSDKAILEVLKRAGANVILDMGSITVQRSSLHSFVFDATDSPDLFPPLAALASCCEGTSVIKGLHRLRHKESDRANTLQQELGKMNIDVSFEQDHMCIEGTRMISGATVNSHNDHRIAMACGILALKANGDVTINNAQAVKKSYPLFFEDLKSLGAKVAVC